MYTSVGGRLKTHEYGGIRDASEEADVKLVRVLRNPAPRPGRIWPSSLRPAPHRSAVSLYSNSRALSTWNGVERRIPRVKQAKRDDSFTYLGWWTCIGSRSLFFAIERTYFRGRCDREEN